MVETEAPVLWPPDAKSCLAGKNPDVGRDGRQKEKRVAEDETAWWYYQLSGHEFAQIAGAGRRKRSLACCSPPGHRVTRVTQGLNITEAKLSDHKQSLPGGRRLSRGLITLLKGPDTVCCWEQLTLLCLSSVTTLERLAALGREGPRHPRWPVPSSVHGRQHTSFTAPPSVTVTSPPALALLIDSTVKLRNIWYLSSNTPYLHTQANVFLGTIARRKENVKGPMKLFCQSVSGWLNPRCACLRRRCLKAALNPYTHTHLYMHMYTYSDSEGIFSRISIFVTHIKFFLSEVVHFREKPEMLL